MRWSARRTLSDACNLLLITDTHPAIGQAGLVLRQGRQAGRLPWSVQRSLETALQKAMGVGGVEGRTHGKQIGMH